MARAADLFYRALYRGLFSRLPERMAVALGQWGLRHLPLDHLTVFRRDDPRLSVSLGGIALANPLILSSMYYDTAILRRAMGLGFGAVTAKSITGSPRPGHPHPNLVRIETGRGAGPRQLQRLQESGPRGLSPRPRRPAPARAADRGRGG
jgi:hypothetical protein